MTQALVVQLELVLVVRPTVPRIMAACWAQHPGHRHHAPGMDITCQWAVMAMPVVALRRPGQAGAEVTAIEATIVIVVAVVVAAVAGMTGRVVATAASGGAMTLTQTQMTQMTMYVCGVCVCAYTRHGAHSAAPLNDGDVQGRRRRRSRR